MTYLLVRDHGADAEKDDSYKGGENVGRNVGVLIGAIAAIIILSPLIARIFGCSFRPTDIHEDHRGAPRNRAQHLDAAQVMRICNRRPAPRIVKPPPTVLTPAEVDVVAPELTYSQLMEAKAQGSLSSVHVERPTPALVKEIRHKDDDTHAAKASEERPSHYTPRPQTRDGETSCSICLEGYSKQDVVRRTSCGHIFHGPCLERWLTKRRSRCPLCQSDLKMREIEEDAN